MRPSSFFAAGVALVLIGTTAAAQVIDLTIHNTGLAIGDKPRMNGIRLNFRDRRLEEINGVNATIWTPYSPASGTVNGLALGVPTTGAGRINGIGLGAFGLGAQDAITGVGIGGIGVGAGGDMKGIFVGGIGVGGGKRLQGLSIGGIGVGGGGSIKGIQIGGIGVGGGGDLTGISIGGIGVGTAGNATGVLVGGVGVGAGGSVKGLAIGGVGVGAPKITGVALGGIGAGGVDVKAIVITGAYFKIADEGRFDGGSLSAVNNVKGAQHGLTIGLWNYARELHGAQVGLINISDNDGRRRVLPLLSVR